jgi:hypothetical protein
MYAERTWNLYNTYSMIVTIQDSYGVTLPMQCQLQKDATQHTPHLP